MFKVRYCGFDIDEIEVTVYSVVKENDETLFLVYDKKNNCFKWVDAGLCWID